jgi:hypothetical protein
VHYFRTESVLDVLVSLPRLEGRATRQTPTKRAICTHDSEQHYLVCRTRSKAEKPWDVVACTLMVPVNLTKQNSTTRE